VIVVYDACVLYPAPMRDTLLRIVIAGYVEARWTDKILDECFGAILKQRPHLSPDALARTRHLMNAVIPDCLVTDYHNSADSIELPDPNDRHVVAAAIKCRAKAIVTMNLRDFPSAALLPFNVKAIHPDQFLREAIENEPELVTKIIRAQAADLQRPPVSTSELLRILESCGLSTSMNRLRELLG